MKKDNKVFIPFIITLICSCILVLAFFLPIASATKEYRELIDRHPDEIAIAEVDMSYKQMKDLSLFSYAKVYRVTATLDSMSEHDRGESIICLVLIITIGVSSVLCVLFSGLKKPIGIFIFDLLAFGAFRALMWDLNDRRVLPSDNYYVGIANIVYMAGVIILFAGAVWLLVMKRKEKKRASVRNEEREFNEEIPVHPEEK